jgi:hypothetical protein
MPKISISLPTELVEYLDSQGPNRSQVIASILTRQRLQEQEVALAQAYREYSAFSQSDDDWWPAWEQAAAQDQES